MALPSDPNTTTCPMYFEAVGVTTTLLALKIHVESDDVETENILDQVSNSSIFLGFSCVK